MTRRAPPDDGSLAERLPIDDASVDALDPRLRSRVGAQWESRATAELRVASIFATLARDLLVVGADPAVLRIAARAVSDEVRHAEICRLLAQRYLGREVPWPSPGRVPMPQLREAPAKLRPTLHLVAMGCINETIATAWLELSYADAKSPLARAALRELMADDIHHARMGWAHLGSAWVTVEMRRQIGRWLGALLQAAATPWLRRARVTLVDGCPAHGVPSLAATRALVEETVDEVILPGLEQLGIPTRAGRQAWRAGASRGVPANGKKAPRGA